MYVFPGKWMNIEKKGTELADRSSPATDIATKFHGPTRRKTYLNLPSWHHNFEG